MSLAALSSRSTKLEKCLRKRGSGKRVNRILGCDGFSSWGKPISSKTCFSIGKLLALHSLTTDESRSLAVFLSYLEKTGSRSLRPPNAARPKLPCNTQRTDLRAPNSSRKICEKSSPVRPLSTYPFHHHEHQTISRASRFSFLDWLGRTCLRIPRNNRPATPRFSGADQRTGYLPIAPYTELVLPDTSTGDEVSARHYVLREDSHYGPHADLLYGTAISEADGICYTGLHIHPNGNFAARFLKDERTGAHLI